MIVESRLPAILLGFVLAASTHLAQAEPSLGKNAVEAALQVTSEVDNDAAHSAFGDDLPLKEFSESSETLSLDPVVAPTEPRFAESEPETITPPPTHSLHVMLDWYINPYHAALIVARERGLLDQGGLDVTFGAPADPNVPPKLVAAERADLALMSQPALHRLVDRGLPLVRVGTLIPVPLSGILARDDRDINSLADLEGRTIGYAVEDEAQVLLDGLLEQQRFGLEAVKLERVDFSLSQALANGDVDAVVGTLRPLDRRQSAQQGVATREFSIDDSVIPLHDALILVANRDGLSEHRRDISHFLDALERATAWMVKHPQAAWELIRTAEPALDTPENNAAWPGVLRLLALRPSLLQTQRYARFEAYLKARGLIERITPVSRFAVEIETP
ncbi:ABC transporter substrate-binding protein [Modicisalibacter radicis]|uniref:ABC transporter substrate-binding protein n=1 Tax=Halomonas sp. EAR18 TaxID=2518972 RepID=UPI00109D4252|nr:ABC transporter substrate-binding protein [Halomonas sp. EAR18]